MSLTPHQAKYFAHELTKKCSSVSMEKLAGALLDAQVDLNPHQVEAALFAFKSPLSNGAILADEVGLGKTIEAGLVLSQKWAENKRKILIITPASLPEKLKLQRKARQLESKRDGAWREFDGESQGIEQRKDHLLDQVEARLQMTIEETELFRIRWQVR